MSSLNLVLGNQLLPDHPLFKDNDYPVVMIEADDICRKLNYHKHKLILILTAMRNYADYLKESDRQVIYRQYQKESRFYRQLSEIITENQIKTLVWMRTSDKSTESSLIKFCQQNELAYEIKANQQFITPAESFEEWLVERKQPLMEQFYRWQRKRTGILMDGDKPVGGEWNYDQQNRQALPKTGLEVPSLPDVPDSSHLKSIKKLVKQNFSDNPGQAENFWMPTDHTQAKRWLNKFFEQRFEKFGRYEDAMSAEQPFLFHSVLSPLINCGLLDPQQVVDSALEAYQEKDIPINSVEGFIRQIIGWREYMYGLYRFGPDISHKNYFGFQKPLEDWWYNLDFRQQNLPKPVKSALEHSHQYGYNHHIERLMVLGNWFLLNQYNPQSVLKWFSSIYVDAYEWVMVPNVVGMSQYADGGYIATKPYISGGNYLQKMGNFWQNQTDAKESDFTRLYWQFLNQQRSKLKDNPRLNLVLAQASKHQSKKSEK